MTMNGYMHHAVFTFLDADHHTEDWAAMSPAGKLSEAHIDLIRAKLRAGFNRGPTALLLYSLFVFGGCRVIRRSADASAGQGNREALNIRNLDYSCSRAVHTR